MAPCCSVFKDQAPKRRNEKHYQLPAGQATVDRHAEGSEHEPFGPRSPRAPGLAAGTDPTRLAPGANGNRQGAPRRTSARFRRPRESTSRRPPRKSSGAGASPRVVDLGVVDGEAAAGWPAGPPRRCSRRGRRAGTARRTWAASAAPSSSTVGASPSATSSSAGSASASRPRPNSASDVRAPRAPGVLAVHQHRQLARPARAARRARAAARRWPRRAPRSPRATGTRTRAGTGPRRHRPGCSQNW